MVRTIPPILFATITLWLSAFLPFDPALWTSPFYAGCKNILHGVPSSSVQCLSVPINNNWLKLIRNFSESIKIDQNWDEFQNFFSALIGIEHWSMESCYMHSPESWLSMRCLCLLPNATLLRLPFLGRPVLLSYHSTSRLSRYRLISNLHCVSFIAWYQIISVIFCFLCLVFLCLCFQQTYNVCVC